MQWSKYMQILLMPSIFTTSFMQWLNLDSREVGEVLLPKGENFGGIYGSFFALSLCLSMNMMISLLRLKKSENLFLKIFKAVLPDIKIVEDFFLNLQSESKPSGKATPESLAVDDYIKEMNEIQINWLFRQDFHIQILLLDQSIMKLNHLFLWFADQQLQNIRIGYQNVILM